MRRALGSLSRVRLGMWLRCTCPVSLDISHGWFSWRFSHLMYPNSTTMYIVLRHIAHVIGVCTYQTSRLSKGQSLKAHELADGERYISSEVYDTGITITREGPPPRSPSQTRLPTGALQVYFSGSNNEVRCSLLSGALDAHQPISFSIVYA